MAAVLRYITDPACVWSWGSEPKLRRLAWEFGTGLEVRFVMGGMAKAWGEAEQREQLGKWLEGSSETGMPCDPLLWRESPLSSTYPGCEAVKAARRQGVAAEARCLRRLREALMCERRAIDRTEVLVDLAAEAGLDGRRLEADLGSDAVREEFEADLEEARAIAEGAGRVSLPTAVFAGENGPTEALCGWQPYSAYRDAALAAGAEIAEDREPTARAVLERFGRVATKEVEVLTGRPRREVEAELWRMASEWRARPIEVLTGTLWEPA